MNALLCQKPGIQADAILTLANKLFEKAKNGDIIAMIFFLKARADWRETVAIEVPDSGVDEFAAERSRTMRLIREGMTPDEREQYLTLLDRARARLASPAG